MHFIVVHCCRKKLREIAKLMKTQKETQSKATKNVKKINGNSLNTHNKKVSKSKTKKIDKKTAKKST